MKTITFLCVLSIAATLLGCKQIIFRKYGMHEPREESPERIRAYLDENGIPQKNVFHFRDSAAYLNYIWDSLAHQQLISTTIFNRQGLLRQLWDPEKCQWSGRYYISRLKTDTSYQADTTRKIQVLLRHVKPLSDDPEEVIDTASWDFMAVVTWGVFLGKYNERQFIVGETARQNTKARVAVIFLNIDMQEEWKLSDASRLKIK